MFFCVNISRFYEIVGVCARASHIALSLTCDNMLMTLQNYNTLLLTCDCMLMTHSQHDDRYVTDDSGVGVVHNAPAFGEDDYRVCLREGIITVEDVPCPIDDSGKFTAPINEYVKITCSIFFVKIL